MVYLHPYDPDSAAEPLAYPGRGYLSKKAGAKIRRTGRASAAAKMEALSSKYDFRKIEKR